MILAPWLKAADVLGAASAGAGIGLQQRAANQRDAEMAQRMQLAEMENARQQQSAAEQLLYHRDALAQARELAMADDAARAEQNQFAREQSAAKLLQDKAEADALSAYRAGQLKNQAERNDIQKNRGTAFVPKFHNVDGVPVVEYEPGKLQIADIPGFEKKAEIPLVKDVPIDPKKPYGVKLNLRANSPLLNQLMSTNNAASILGTNWVAPMPKITPKAAPVAQAPVVEATTAPTASPVEPKVLEKSKAAEFLQVAGGDKKKARELARAAGYTF